jgi:nucleotide-binding universal stress UspA family protein
MSEPAAPFLGSSNDLSPDRRKDIMNHSAATLPIVVGIDGSKQAVRAAIWASDEAVSRDTPLRLLHVVDGNSTDLDRDYEYAEHIVHKAWTAVEKTGKPVKLESDIRQGDPVAELVEVSRKAEMICVGAKGTITSGKHKPGSTAAALGQSALCPVAIVRRRHTHKPLPAGRWVIAALDESLTAPSVLQTAMDEALLRNAPLLALTPWGTRADDAGEDDDDTDLRTKLHHYLDEAADDNADVQVCALPMPDNMSNLLEQSAHIDQLVIVGANNPELVAEVVGPKAQMILRDTNCSLLILRDRPSP